ncbi:hypothetical protein JTE90_010735 [Oedothorax gibbosus]|uniref:Uncharacterized protein n=1 Tax=Oedothorax gibbosus TaxID=931172 RepID=A0AAV6UEF5_9ARAC|nr:hypothetical protein JTE90_010735 [Oedothorax gibbosus]
MSKVCFSLAAMFVLISLVTCHYRERRSGISDQRLAEIETLLALAKQGGNRDVAYGIIDPIMLGKRKRNSADLDSLNQLEEDFPADVLRDAWLKLPSSRVYSHGLPERLFRFRELENSEGSEDNAK